MFTIDNNFSSVAATISGGLFGGILLGYALKKVIRIAAIIVGLFIAGLAFLQHQQIASINWDKIQGSITALANATASTLNDNSITTLAISNFSIPLTSHVRLCYRWR